MFCAGRACRMASDIFGDEDGHSSIPPPPSLRRTQMERRRTIATGRATADADPSGKARAYGYGVVG